MRELLSRTPKDVGFLTLPNYEARPTECEVLNSPFIVVTAFMKNYMHVPALDYSRWKQFVRQVHPDYFLLYANGKPIARLAYDLEPVGVHEFQHTNGTFMKHLVASSAAILHYPFVSVKTLTEKLRRCDCSQAQHEKCSMFSFEKDLHRKASNSSESVRSMFDAHVRIDLGSDYAQTLFKAGILVHIHTPSVLLRQLKEGTLRLFRE